MLEDDIELYQIIIQNQNITKIYVKHRIPTLTTKNSNPKTIYVYDANH